MKRARAPIGKRSLFAAMDVVGVGSLVWLIWDSFVEWRANPDRVPVTGTRPASDERG